MKLLNRTIKHYALFSVLLVLCCTPFFYFTIQKLFVSEMDKVLVAHKADFNQSMQYLKTDEEIRLYHLMNKEFTLIPQYNALKKDTFFTENFYDSSEAETVPHRVYHTHVMLNGKSYTLEVKESLVSTRGLITAIMGVQAIMLLLLIAGLVLINRALSHNVWDPFYAILERLKKYQIDQNQALTLPHSSTAEFRDLSNAINQLVTRNHESYLNQKEFTENASHEMQTPLAISRAKLELLAQTKELTKEQADLVGDLLNAIDRLSRLTRNLLLLSKIENRQFLEITDVDLRTTISKCLETYSQQIKDKSLNVKSQIASDTVLSGNLTLLDVLIGNLISNAVRHGTMGGEIHIDCSNKMLVVANVGEPLAQSHKIFQRFQRESRTTQGSGLGLSLVKKICDISGYQISYSYQDKKHSFKIVF
jgi:signal transduction histidine kinase